MHRERSTDALHQFIVVEPFDRTHLLVVASNRESNAGTHRFAVDKDGARAAHSVLAPQVGAGQILAIAQEIAQMRARCDLAAYRPVVDSEFNDRHGNSR
ncbi:hypothetical protein GGD70_002465 [Paraburkholderia fungorum]|nr:hypothetical protein [Paraburkholderia fungorum]